jgi:tyrosinase
MCFRVREVGTVASDSCGPLIVNLHILLDPIFYLHHGNLDRVWWIWQKKDLKRRLKDISGPTTQNPPYTEVTLDFGLKMSNLAPLVSIRDVMDTTGELLCYIYV